MEPKDDPDAIINQILREMENEMERQGVVLRDPVAPQVQSLPDDYGNF